MTLPELVEALTGLHADAAGILAAAHGVRLPPTMLVWRGPIDVIEKRLDEAQRRFAELDAAFLAHAGFAQSINTTMRGGSGHIQIVASIRSAVHDLLRDAADTLTSMHSRLDFRGSLAISVSAVVIAVLALVRDLLWG